MTTLLEILEESPMAGGSVTSSDSDVGEAEFIGDKLNRNSSSYLIAKFKDYSKM
jgi:hypothetical protein